ncbi:MAG: CDP-glucose 4,6-dehydratase [Deltaproteobacteria bacterium]|nr:CDP-glucose 4,6-dehydratase [Deltaproteobacteria bacterium]
MNRTFWVDKSVFVTGHTGFKGGWLSLWLKLMGASVVGYALEPAHHPCLFHQARVGHEMNSVLADVRDADKLRQAMAESSPELAFHFAAQPLVRASYKNPSETYATNVMGTVNFLEAVRQTPSIRVAIVVTSDKCYENLESQRGYREEDAMGGSDPYSSSKGCAELVATSYQRSFFNDSRVALATVRAGNVIGGGDWAADRLMPDLVRAFSAGEALKLRYPRAVRPWQHVLEPLRGYLMLAERLWNEGNAYSGGWNFGPSQEDARPVLDVVRTSAKLWGDGAEWRVDAADSPREANLLRLDCTRANRFLGWTPAMRLEDTLEWTIAWYRACIAGDIDMRRFTEEQLKRYETLCEEPLAPEMAPILPFARSTRHGAEQPEAGVAP